MRRGQFLKARSDDSPVSIYAGIKRRIRMLNLLAPPAFPVKHPERYLHAHERRRRAQAAAETQVRTLEAQQAANRARAQEIAPQ